MSLRMRLVLLAALVMAVSLGLVGVALDAAFYRSSVTGLQSRMESTAYLVLAATEIDADGSLKVDKDLGDPRLGQPGSGLYAHVHGRRDHWSSPSSLNQDLPELPAVKPGESLFLQPGDGRNYFVFRYGVAWELADGSRLPITVSIFIDPREMREEVSAFRAGLGKSLGAVGIILLLAQLLFLTLGLRPLRRLTHDIAGIESGRIEQLEGNYPRELEPLTRNLNHLLETEKANQTRYRNALDSLAHSLKTPLSVIRSSMPADTPAKAKAVETAVTDMQHLIATRLQRAAASARSSMARAVDVQHQAERLCQSLSRVYSHKMIDIDANIEPGLAFYGEQRDLLELLGNLLDNACKYGHGKVRVRARSLDPKTPRAGIRLSVADNGPGIAQEARRTLLKRGVRGDERVDGHGLGLAIVLEIVSAYNGEIGIDDSELGGARVKVVLKTQ